MEKAPSSKLQAPEKVQEPSSKTTDTGRVPLPYRAENIFGDWSSGPDGSVEPGRMRFECSGIGGWDLEFPWSLELGIGSIEARLKKRGGSFIRRTAVAGGELRKCKAGRRECCPPGGRESAATHAESICAAAGTSAAQTLPRRGSRTGASWRSGVRNHIRAARRGGAETAP